MKINKQRKRTLKMLTIINLFLFLLIIAILYFLRPLPNTESWISAGHIVRVDPYINAGPMTNQVNHTPTNIYMTYVNEVEVSTRWNRLTTNLHGYEKRDFSSSYSSQDSPKDFTKRDLNMLGKILLPFMKHDIIKAAMVYKQMDWEESISPPIVIYHPEKFKTGESFHIGDEIIEINGELIESVDDIYVILEPFDIGDKVNVKLNRGDDSLEFPIVIKELDARNRATLGVYLKHKFTFTDLSEVDVIHLEKNHSGESGGFMLTLGLIQQLEPNVDLSKGLKIAGTGGITRGGDIKPIGNLDIKVQTAINEKADVFFYPIYQEEEIKEVKKNYPIGDMKLIGVRNVKEAIEYLLQS